MEYEETQARTDAITGALRLLAKHGNMDALQALFDLVRNGAYATTRQSASDALDSMNNSQMLQKVIFFQDSQFFANFTPQGKSYAGAAEVLTAGSLPIINRENPVILAAIEEMCKLFEEEINMINFTKTRNKKLLKQFPQTDE